jgi:branched-subunit amino acid aminotransferase/4-amino-4-deoxychorismate lyase
VTAPLAFLNGRFVPPGELALSFADAGFVSAATVTDFCRTYNRRLFRWPAHLARLRRDCAALGLELPFADAELTAAAERLVAGADGEAAVITVVTPGPLGYLLGTDTNGPPTVGMHALPLPAGRYRRFFADGVTLAVAGGLPGGLPADVKHRSRLHWWLADRATAHTHPGAVAVLTDPAGTPDTALGNVLVVRDGGVVRPPAGAVLEGISMSVVGELCGRVGVPFAVGPVDVRDLGRATEVLLTGSGFGVAGVRRVGDRGFDWPGPVFTRLLGAWAESVGQSVEQITFAAGWTPAAGPIS